MRILAGSVCRQTPEVLDAHLKTLLWQKGDFELDFFFVDDNDKAASSTMLRGVPRVTIVAAEPKPAAAKYAVNETTHDWNVPTFHWLARQKQRILDHAMKEGYDAVWLVDSDLLSDPHTLQSLVGVQKPIVSAVFWTRWQPRDPPLPQVWVRHPYGFEGAGWTERDLLQALESGELVRVRGLGANTLIRRGALEKGCGYWPLVEGLPEDGMWQGEDRHFCVRAERLHVELWADAWPDVWHCYRPSDRAAIPDVLEKLSQERPPHPETGHSVSLRLEPLEDPALFGRSYWVRGRVGALPLLPELENALLGMPVGDAQILALSFPNWWPVAEYRNQERLVRVTLQDIKGAA